MAYDPDHKQQIFMRMLLNRYHPTGVESVLKCLPAETAKGIFNQSPSSKDPSEALLQPEDYIREMHYSWLIEPIKKFPPSLHPLLLGALAEDQKGPLAKLLRLAPAGNVSPSLRRYVCRELYFSLDTATLIPKAFISPSSLSPLLQLSKKRLVELIDYLGLYDLAEEIRGIVDTKNLKTIYQCLSAKKQQFLRICLHQREKLITPKLHLDKWEGDCQQLSKLLHMRGIFRLGKTLSGQKGDLILFLTHTLDTGRGKILAEHVGPQEIPGVTQALVLQILNAINFLEQGSA